MTNSLPRLGWLPTGLIAGIVAGFTVTLYTAIAQWRIGRPPAEAYAFFASVLVGAPAEGASWAVPVGILVLFAAAILWAFGYLWLAQRQPQLVTRPWISGIGFGVLVWFAMLVVLVGVGKFQQPTIYTFDRDMVGVTLFFGLPLALVAARLTRA